MILANWSGVSSAIGSSRWRQQRLLILGYHGLSQDDEHEWSDLYITSERMEQRLAQLHEVKATVLPLEVALENLYAGTLPPRAVCLSFDDGFCDFALKAAPILTAAQMHTTLYLTTHYTRKVMPVFAPFASYLLWKARSRTVLLPGLQTRVRIPRHVNDPEFTKLHQSVLEYATNARMTSDDKHEFARELAIAVGADFDDLCRRRILHLMNPEEIRSLDPRWISIQLHTHRHPDTGAVDNLQYELDRNAAEIASLSGRSDATRHFCYPSGVYSREFVDRLRDYGVKSATTCQPGYSTDRTPRLEIPRLIDTMSVADDAFKAWVLGSAAVTRVGRLPRPRSHTLESRRVAAAV